MHASAVFERRLKSPLPKFIVPEGTGTSLNDNSESQSHCEDVDVVEAVEAVEKDETAAVVIKIPK
jgi:hypothetical protein